MNARFTVTNRLVVGFGIVIIVSIINGLLIYSTLNQNQKLNDELMSVYNPSSAKLQELYSMINNSQMLVKNWVFIEKQDNTPDKKKLYDIHNFDFPELQKELVELSVNWDNRERQMLDTIFISIKDTLFQSHSTIMQSLSTFSSYDDLMVLFEVTPMVEEGGSVIENTQDILSEINTLQESIGAKEEASNLAMSESFVWFQKFVTFSIIVLVFIVLIVGFFTARNIVLPILKLKDFLTTMTKGILPEEQLETNNDEVGDMGDSLNGYIANMRKTSEFAVAIGNGNYEKEFEALSSDDILGNSLIEMRNNLHTAEVDNKKRSEEDKIRNWITTGLAEFGDILRQNSDNMDVLSKNVMTKLIDYLGVTQGAIYIVAENEDEGKIFEMKCAVAYNREKYMHKTFAEDEGLVGRCAFEKAPVYLKEIPDNYINITSGLGTAEPTNLLLVPLIVNEEVMGVVEIASLTDILDYQIEFVSTLGENIASTISNVRINEQTKKLLDDSKLRADELSAQEEELRQNMEELQATQEESQRRDSEMANTIVAINNTLGTIEIDRNRTITTVNDNFTDLTHLDINVVVGNPFKSIFATETDANEKFDEVWAELQLGSNRIFESKMTIASKEFWFKHTMTPLKDVLSGKLIKVIDLVIDITKEKELEHKLEQMGMES